MNRKIILVLIAFLAAAWFGVSSGTCADKADAKKSGAEALPRFEMEETVVIGTRLDDTIEDVPANVSVITDQDMAQAPEKGAVELLGREASVIPKSFFGSDKWAGVDIRGMGDTSASNVAVMVDGLRLNPPDLSGPDFSSIPLGSIDRIEILRGAASVLYGDGAVGGVVNILTKKAKDTPKTEASASYGSYDSYDARASSLGRVKSLGYSVYASYSDTDGYRENSGLLRKDAGLELSRAFLDKLTVSVQGAYHADTYGLPGGVSLEDVGSRDLRRETNHPDDGGRSEDRRVLGSLEWDLETWGQVRAQAGYQWRNTDYVFCYSPLILRQDQTNTVNQESGNGDIRYVKDYAVYGKDGRLTCGIEDFRTRYVSARPTQNERYNVKSDSVGLFAQNKLALNDTFTLHAGLRHNAYDGRFRKDERVAYGTQSVWVNGDQEKNEWKNDVYDVGLVVEICKDLSAFGSFSTSFRVPNADELAKAAPNLRPQHGTDAELGARYKLWDKGEISLTLFDIRIKDEIFYSEDPANPDGENTNYEDPTRRQGVELEFKLYPLDTLYVWANYTYMEAVFEGADTFVPLVPDHKASLGLEWRVREPLCLSATLTYVGSRYDGNDRNNTAYPKLDPYTVTDLKLTYTRKGLKVFAAINNVFDALYETVAYSEMYYPMPTRNFTGGLEYVF